MCAKRVQSNAHVWSKDEHFPIANPDWGWVHEIWCLQIFNLQDHVTPAPMVGRVRIDLTIFKSPTYKHAQRQHGYICIYEILNGIHGGGGILQASSTEWLEMRHVWGASWCIIRGPLRGPFSVKLTTLSTGRTLSARDVIPRNWAPKATYTSRLNFF